MPPWPTSTSPSSTPRPPTGRRLERARRLPTSTRSSCSATPTTSSRRRPTPAPWSPLLHVRDILAGSDAATPVVSEMLDDRNRVLAQVAHVDDVIVSGEIVSLMVTQLSEDHRLEAVFAELLGDEGSEIYLRPAEWYVEPGAEVNFATVVAGATGAARPRSATSRPRWPRPRQQLRRPGEPREVGDLPGRSRATGWSCSPRTEPLASQHALPGGPARARGVRRREPVWTDGYDIAAARDARPGGCGRGEPREDVAEVDDVDADGVPVPALHARRRRADAVVVHAARRRLRVQRRRRARRGRPTAGQPDRDARC